ncbi:BapA prefix-like domain-containing protein [Acinetobacter pseudolwoffii]|uniref:GA-like domain-containing protein n=1 Tax=Acinetobacter pseudolwoffii TaxID=2053287 RepID=UPI0036201AA5
MQVQVISKVDGSNQLVKEYLEKIVLTKDSIVLVDIKIEDIEKIEYLSNQAVITLKNGEKIVVDNFDEAESSLVFRNEKSELYLFDFETISYNPIDKIEPLLYGQSESTFISVWPFVGLALSGIGLIAAGSSGSSSSSENNDSIVDEVVTQIAVTEAAVKKAEKSHADTVAKLQDHDANEDGIISQSELDSFLSSPEWTQAQTDKAAAAEKVALVADADVKSGLEDRLEALTAPLAGDLNDNGNIDPAEQVILDALAAVEKAEKSHADTVAKLQDHDANEDGIISQSELDSFLSSPEWTQAQTDKAAAAEKVALVADADVKSGLEDRLEALTAPLAGDLNDNGNIDPAEQVILDALAAVEKAEKSHADTVAKLQDHDANEDGIISQSELDSFLSSPEWTQAQTDKAAAAEKVALVADADVKSGLEDRLEALTAPLAGDLNDNGNIDPAEQVILDALAAVEKAEKSHADTVAKLQDHDANEDGIISQSELDSFLSSPEWTQAQTDKAAAAEKVALVADADVKSGLEDRLEALTAPLAGDLNDNGNIDPAEQVILDALAAVEKAEKSHADTVAKLQDHDANEDGIISQSELDSFLSSPEWTQAQTDKAAAAEKVALVADADVKSGLEDRLEALTAPLAGDLNDNGNIDPAEQVILDALAAVEKAEKSHADTVAKLQDHDANEDGIISQSELDSFLSSPEWTQAQTDKAAAAEKVALVADADVKSGLEDRLEALTAPLAGDLNDNGNIDPAEQVILDALAAVEKAEKSHADTVAKLQDHDANEDGIISQSELDSFLSSPEWTQAQTDKAAAAEKVALVADADVKSGLEDRLEALTAPLAGDLNDNGNIDPAEQVILDALAAVEKAEKSHADTVAKLQDHDANEDGIISQSELDSFLSSPEWTQAQTDKAAAAEKVALVADADVKSGLEDRLEALTAPLAGDLNDNGNIDPAEQVILDALAAVEKAEKSYADTVAKLQDHDANEDGIISQSELDSFLSSPEWTQAQTDKAAAAEKVALVADADVKSGLEDRLEALTAPLAGDLNDNGNIDPAEQVILDALAAVEKAEKSHADTVAKLQDHDANEDGIISQSELDSFLSSP